MGLFSRKDWNIIAIIFQTRDVYQVNGNRVKGSGAKKAVARAKGHRRTIYYAVFDQNGKLVESGPGAGDLQIPGESLKQLKKELRTNSTVLNMLKTLETTSETQVAKPLVWTGYPTREIPPE